MADLKEKISKISHITCQDLNLYELAVLNALQDKVDAAKRDLQTKAKVIASIKDKIEQLEFNLKSESQEKDDAEIKEKLEMAAKRNEILRSYMNTLQSDEFAPYKLKRDIDEANKEFWFKLKPLNDKAAVVKKRLEELSQLQAVCDDLRQRTHPVEKV